MRVIIGSRASDLARAQAYSVGEALTHHHPHLQIDYVFRASLGDQNQHDPLWKMPQKGVFTEDFVDDLLAERVDMVVHSWKDLPTEARLRTQVVATLPRADMRDLFLLRKDRWKAVTETGALRLLSSSPRRMLQVETFAKDYLPAKILQVEFKTVRGNVPTRLKKLLSEDVDGLVVAKAAIDRLLTAPRSEFEATAKEVRSAVDQCFWQVLPLQLVPGAAAQGALAIEIKRGRKNLEDLLAPIHCAQTWSAVSEEREILSSYGGGCQQKIGISVCQRDYGRLQFICGQTEKGESLNSIRLHSTKEWAPPRQLSDVWPHPNQTENLFVRESVCRDLALFSQAPFLWVARASAWPKDATKNSSSIVWAAGLKTWRQMAQRGIWVNGCAESLGEGEESRIEDLVGQRSIDWLKLTHDQSEAGSFRRLATYRLQVKPLDDSLQEKTHFFWSSGLLFDQALRQFPEIKEAWHFTGPGHTRDHLRARLPHSQKLVVVSDGESWWNLLKSQVDSRFAPLQVDKA